MARRSQGQQQETLARDPAWPETYARGERVPPEHLQWLWRDQGARNGALLSVEACSRISSTLDNVRFGPPGPRNKQHPPRPVRRTVHSLRHHIKTAEAHWQKEQEGSDGGTARAALQTLAELRTALDRTPLDWLLEPEMRIVFEDWESAARVIYPVLVSECLHAGRTVAKPHPNDPLCKFLHAVLKLIDMPSKSVGGLMHFLLGQLGAIRGRRGKGGGRSPANPAELVAEVERENFAPQTIWGEVPEYHRRKLAEKRKVLTRGKD